MKEKKGIRLLLIEHDHSRNGLFKKLLERSDNDSTDVIRTAFAEGDLEVLREEPFDLVLVDYPLSGIKALDVIRKVREMNLDIPITMVTGEESARAALKAIKLGSSDYMVRSNLLSARQAATILGVTIQTIKNYIYNGRLNTYKTPGGHHRIRWNDILNLGFLEEGASQQDLYRSYIDTLEALTDALDARDGNQSGHSRRVAKIVTSLTEIMKISGKDQEDIKLAALLHDVGKILISERVLSKPGRLTDQERYLVQQHPELGERIVSGVEFLQGTKPIIRHHHERFDGNGYPDRLSDNEIPLGARMILFAESFDCMTSECTYHPKRSTEEAALEIERCAGTQLDPEIARIFSENRDEVIWEYYPASMKPVVFKEA